MTAVALAVGGLILALAAVAGAGWSLWRLPGTAAGASLSAVCAGLAACSLALVVASFAVA